MNKKLLQITICICTVLFSMYTAQAATVVQVNESEKTVKIVSDGYESGELGTIIVLNPEDDMSKTDISDVDENNAKEKLYYTQTSAADEDGNLIFNFKLSDSMKEGLYSIRIFGQNSEEADWDYGEFFYVPQSQIEQLRLDINSETNFADCVNKLIKYVTLSEDYLGDGTAQNPNDKYRTKITETFLRNKRAVSGYNDYRTLKEAFYHTVAEVQMVLNPSDTQKALSCLKISGTALPEKTEENIAQICANMGRYSIQSDAQYLNAIAQASAVAEINKMSRSELNDGLSKYEELLGFSSNASYKKYTELSTDEKIQVCAKLTDRNFTAPSEILSALGSALPKSGSTGGGGGSSYGSRGSSDGISLGTVMNPISSNGQTSIPKCRFNDLNEFGWAQTAISMFYEKGIISGRTDEVFAPKDSVTRAEFLKMAMEAFELTDDNAVCSFSDVDKSDWFYKYVASATEKEIVYGYEDMFKPNDKITRQDIAVMLGRIVEASEIEAGFSLEEKVFDDEDLISDYAVDSVKEMRGYGFIEGDSDNLFRPKDNASRAEAAVLLYRVYLAK